MHFVGRVGAMTRVSAALAVDSPAGAGCCSTAWRVGKTSCAVELIHHHAAGRFQGFVWYPAPEQGKTSRGAA